MCMPRNKNKFKGWAKRYYAQDYVRKYRRKWFAEFRAKRRAAGLCSTFGEPKEKGVDCRRCRKTIQKWRKANPHKVKVQYKRHDLKRAFGLTLEEFLQKVNKQNGVCAICGCKNFRGNRIKHLVVDHNHQTGKMRALLCDSCNRGMGLLKDDVIILQRAVAYLTAHS